MINVRPGYWDVATCSWVGAEPMYLVPPVLRSESPASADDRTGLGTAEVPAPRHRRADEAPVTAAPPGS